MYDYPRSFVHICVALLFKAGGCNVTVDWMALLEFWPQGEDMLLRSFVILCSLESSSLSALERGLLSTGKGHSTRGWTLSSVTTSHFSTGIMNLFQFLKESGKSTVSLVCLLNGLPRFSAESFVDFDEILGLLSVLLFCALKVILKEKLYFIPSVSMLNEKGKTKMKKYTTNEDCGVGSVLGLISNLLDSRPITGKHFQRFIHWISKSLLDNWPD